MLKRIQENEERLDKIISVVKELENALNNFEDIQNIIKELELYYGSENWFKDKDAHDKGEIKNIKAGVLSEDAVWNTLTDIREIYERMYEISKWGT